ncbi:MAG: PH domain-containing protein [bacterium]|nr:PH domain-containing protein [bacterium]
MSYVEKKRTKLFGLPWTFTKYMIDDEKVTIRSGFLSIVEDDAYMYKVQDVRLVQSFLERLSRIGTVICYTGDTTHPELKLEHIRRAPEIKAYLMKASEEARIKRRTINTVDIAHGMNPEVDDIDFNE